MKSKILLLLILVVSTLSFYSCATLNKISQQLTNLQRLQFKLENINNFSLMGIGLSNKKSISDFSISDGLKFASALSSNSFPARFTLNVAAMNPNTGADGSVSSSATITSLDWQLYIDDVPTIRGDISSPLEIPGTGKSTIIPISMELDLYKFFSGKGKDGIINLALALGGVNGSAARVKLDAKPTVDTPFGPLVYPGRITIIDKKFSS